MCGIAGIISKHSNVNPNHIVKMTNALKHRGPDDEGFLAVNSDSKEISVLIGNHSKIPGRNIKYFHKNCNMFLGHRRLSILDPSSAGHQPMPNNNNSIYIVHNGEIYNFIELRKELSSKGYKFKTRTDTEVLIASYEEWGINCVNKFNGMWAFVIYDSNKNIIFGSRDIAGVKPLYFYNNPDYFAFASEIKAFLKLPFIKFKINDRAAFQYLVFGLIEREEESFLKNIFELKPAHSFILDLNNFTFKKWRHTKIDYENIYEKFNKNKFEQFKKDTRELIFNAVNLRLRSDVSLGSCLSGGIDSSSIVCVTGELLKKRTYKQVGLRQKVFTASYKNEPIDESYWASIVANKVNAEWYQTFPTVKSLLQDLEDLIYYQDIPFGSTSVYAQYKVMKLARGKGVKVLLDGQGGDELFTGYQRYIDTFFRELLKNFRLLTLLNEIKNKDNLPLSRHEVLDKLYKALIFIFKENIKQITPKSLIEFKRYLHSNPKITQLSEFINKDFLLQFDKLHFSLETKVPNNLNQDLHSNFFKYGLKNLLRFEDRNSMRFSIEARTPFADDIELINYIFKKPSSYKMHNGWTKYLLRAAMEDILPKEILYRKDKVAFETPENKWLEENKKQFLKYFSENLNPYINTNKILEMINSNNSQIEMGSNIFWRFLNFAIWCHIYCKNC